MKLGTRLPSRVLLLIPIVATLTTTLILLPLGMIVSSVNFYYGMLIFRDKRHEQLTMEKHYQKLRNILLVKGKLPKLKVLQMTHTLCSRTYLYKLEKEFGDLL